MTVITSKTARAKLTPRRAPYWTQLGRGAYLGFRRSASGAGTWHARYRDRNGDQHYQSLGEVEEFADAKARAERWLAQASHGARRAPSRGTVRSALTAYILHLRSIGRRKAARDAGKRFHLTVPKSDPFGVMRLEEVTKEDVEAWRDRLRKGRLPRTVNRNVRNVVAGLNLAVTERGHIGNREAWKLVHLVDEGEENVAVFLTTDQRDRIIAAATKPLANLLTGYTHTGARPSELAKATVGDFDPKGGTVTLRHHKGRGGKLRARAVMLSDAGAAFFKTQARGKLPQAPLISNDVGGHWTDQQWCAGIERTIKAVNDKAKKPAQRIPKGASAYSFRHTRISELLQIYGVDPLTVAQQTGTGLNMIEKYYFKFISSSMRDKLNAVKSA
jgi:integrase